MENSAFRSSTSLHPDRREPAATPPSRKERLAIVSTSSKLCGIAAYTAALQRQLHDAFDITVFDLNQYLLRNPHRRVRKLADRHIKEICRAIQGFDVVNLQLEYGTLGRYGSDIHRRFRWLATAAPRLSVTFHTLLMPPAFDAAGFTKSMATLRFKAAAQLHAEFRRNQLLSYGIARQLRRLQRHKHVSAIVHNRRDLFDAHYLYGIANVFDHPLCYLGADDVAEVRAAASRSRFPMLDELPPDAVLIGVFGFLNEYKGIGTAIQALQHLPKNHHLLIFGGIHPQEIARGQQRHPYISSLFYQAYVDTTLYDRLNESSAPGAPPLVIEADQGLRALAVTEAFAAAATQATASAPAWPMIFGMSAPTRTRMSEVAISRLPRASSAWSSIGRFAWSVAARRAKSCVLAEDCTSTCAGTHDARISAFALQLAWHCASTCGPCT